MKAAPLRLRRGQFVLTYFDTGALGPQPLYGLVIAAGPKAFRVRWESGLTNRIRQGHGGVARIPATDLDDRARAALLPEAR